MLPLIVHIKKQLACDEYKSPCALILTPYQPSKEDIYAATKDFLEAAGIRCLTIYDGEEKEQQKELLKSSGSFNIRCCDLKSSRKYMKRILDKFDLLIANPIRLNDLIEEERENDQDLISLSNVSFVIVDEYIQFRKSQTMDIVKKCVERTKVKMRTE
jgi:superfamily II DNA/RNA helicase